MPSLNIYTIYMIAIAVLLCVIEFVLVRMEKNDLAIGLPILVLTESFVSGLNVLSESFCAWFCEKTMGVNSGQGG